METIEELAKDVQEYRAKLIKEHGRWNVMNDHGTLPSGQRAAESRKMGKLLDAVNGDIGKAGDALSEFDYILNQV